MSQKNICHYVGRIISVPQPAPSPPQKNGLLKGGWVKEGVNLPEGGIFYDYFWCLMIKIVCCQSSRSQRRLLVDLS